jgi:acyl dehydratase
MTIIEDGKIDDAGLEHIRSQIGIQRSFRPWVSTATADSIWHFCLGLGDDNPLWLDREYAEQTKWGSLIAPPGYLAVCASGGSPPGVTSSGEVDDLLPGVLGLWYNDRWKHYAPAREGMALAGTQELWSVEELPDVGRGRRVLQTERQSFYGDGQLLSECDKTIMRFERADSKSHKRSAVYEKPQYTEEDRRAINEQYERETDQRWGSRSRSIDDVQVGEAIPRLVKGPLTIAGLVGWLLGWGSFMTQTNRLQYKYLRSIRVR